MRTASSRDCLSAPANVHRRAGVTLVEVLVAIFITGVGLLALLTLFPLGALDLAQAVKDDRTARIADDAERMSDAGEELLARTRLFVMVSLVTGVDVKTAADLRVDYEALAEEAAAIEAQLLQFRPSAQTPKVTRKVDRLLKEIRAIKRSFGTLASLLRRLEAPQ